MNSGLIVHRAKDVTTTWVGVLISQISFGGDGKSFPQRATSEPKHAPLLPLPALWQPEQLVQRLPVALRGEEIAPRARMLPSTDPDGLACIIDNPKLVVGRGIQPAHRLVDLVHAAGELDRLDEAVRLRLVALDAGDTIPGHGLDTSPPRKATQQPSTVPL